ncbi:T9SS type A sorting domain-containing protein [Flavobacterium azooxidireducens]|uniref:T9SS type A sorting domain-containing protein n=1 Tax=Flavobacterium azooxidireducens TaxID=1871076 RepID=A0ABY4KDL6_9FLAO|nr:T9SS type A sorting domain-containing protein [Flavobacterium azooxidireducens]UPQ78891.1 T9SS type A sorting domain-containing protein [Flavobacterium azooxidireducens]
MKRILSYLTILFISVQLNAQVTITQATGWLETAYVTWTPLDGVDSYNVYYTGGGFTNQPIDTQLIRNYGSYFRADVLGLAAGDYTIKVVPVTGGVEGAEAVSNSVSVLAQARNGFAHSNGRAPGGYTLTGTVKPNAVILYITEQNKNTISLTVTGATSNPCVGLQTILDGFKKGNDNRPLIVRLIGNITGFSNMYNGDIVIENKNNVNGSITFEGVGSDALANGWGIRIKKGTNIEIRNLGLMLTASGEGDNIGLQQDNDYIWVHNCDLFYGNPGSASDQAKGDGALDVKRSGNVTISYNHFWDTGKSNLLGNGTEAARLLTYHHNWYDHSDSRHPRVRSHTVHIYNNYYDGVSKYGAGSTLASSLFMEGNYFRNTKYPMLISKQGSDIAGGAPGTFSGENGGMIKAYNNFMIGQQSFLPYNATTNPNQFDAYVASTRNEVLSNNVSAFQGGATYNNFDTNPIHYINNLVIDEPEVARDRVIQYSGRVGGGDISWTFDAPGDDTSYAINSGLLALLQNYTSNLVAVQGIGNPVVSTQTLTIPSNNDQTVPEGNAISNMVFTWGGTATDVTVTGLPAFGISFVKNMAAKTVTVSGTPTEDVDFTITTIGSSGSAVSGGGSITIGDGSVQGEEIHNFTESVLNSSFYTFTSANMNSTPGNTTYNGLTLTARLKIETPTIISYTTMAESELTLVLDPTFNGTIKVDNVNYTASAGLVTIPSVPAGSHTITKGSVANLYYIKTAYTNLSVNNPISKKDIILYPNPVTNDLNISIANSITVERISIYSLIGQLVKSVDGSNVTTINMSDLTNGVYMVKIQTNQGVIDQKIIKK